MGKDGTELCDQQSFCKLYTQDIAWFTLLGRHFIRMYCGAIFVQAFLLPRLFTQAGRTGINLFYSSA